MIYLFDDTPNIKDYFTNDDFLGEIILISSFPSYDVEKLSKKITNNDCILLHRSFRDCDYPNDTIVFEYVFEDLSDCGRSIPIVIFSDGDINGEFKNQNFVSKLKKSVMYAHLEEFVLSYRKTKTYDFRILLFGIESENMHIIELGRSIITDLKFLKDSDIILPAQINLRTLSSLLDKAKPAIKMDSINFEKRLNKKEISAGMIRYHINEILKSIISYGKNLHSWE